jgi:hypothetical protein
MQTRFVAAIPQLEKRLVVRLRKRLRRGAFASAGLPRHSGEAAKAGEQGAQEACAGKS